MNESPPAGEAAADTDFEGWVAADASNCGVLAATDIVGDQWSLLILRDAMLGVRRFDQFQKHLGVSRTVLADRLQKLVQWGVMKQVEYREGGSRSRSEYRLTRRGWDLQLIVLALREWGNRYQVPREEQLLDLVEAGTEEPVELALVRASDGKRVELKALRNRPGPGMDSAAH